MKLKKSEKLRKSVIILIFLNYKKVSFAELNIL